MRRFAQLSSLGVLLLLGGCDKQLSDTTPVRVASKAPRAHGTLVIDTDDPAYPHWRTQVEFSPK